MAYTTKWYRQNIVGYAEITGQFTGGEMEAVNTDIKDLFLEKGDAPVHVIVDASQVTSYPRNVRVIQHAFNEYLKHPSLGWIVFIGFNNPFVSFLATTVTQIAGIRFKHVKSLDEANRVLERLDRRLTNENIS